MDRTKARYFAVAVFLSAFCLFTGGTYSYFALSKFLSAATISIAKLNYELTSTDTNFQNNSITVGAGKTVKLTLDLKSLNAQNTKYALDYISDNPNLKVYYVGNMEQNVQGEIGELNSIININIVIKNTGASSETVRFDLKGGYLQNTLESNINEAQPSSPLKAVSYNESSKLWAHKANIKKVVFETSINPKENATYSYDISQDGDESVMSYLVSDSEDSTKYVAYIQSNGKTIANKYSGYLFYNFSSLESIEGLENLNTSNVTDMYGMFFGCSSLTTLNISNFDTGNVTNMSDMFENCTNLTTLNVSSFDTNKVTNMDGMFSNCSSLTTLDVSNFDTSKVTNMSSMFFYCSNLTTLDVSGFDTRQVYNMSFMFSNCSSLTTLNVSNFDTSKVTNMSFMFDDCSSLTILDLSNFDTGEVTKMESMLSSCSNLTTLDVSNFDTSKVINMKTMFGYCSSLMTLDLSSFDTSNTIDMGHMFSGCRGLTTLINNFDTSMVTDMSNMFYDCSSFITLDLSNFDTSNVTSMSYMFRDCSSLTTLNLSNFDTSMVTDMSNMFQNCTSLTTLNVSRFDTSNVTDISGMFYNCSSLTTLDLSNFDTSNVTDFGSTVGYKHGMFEGCTNLTATITIIGTKCTNYAEMFESAATAPGAQIIVNYTSDASDLVDNMIATKSSSSNVIKASQPESIYSIILSDVTDITLSSNEGYRLKQITLTPTVEGKVITSFKVNGELKIGNTFKMPGTNVTISDVVLIDLLVVESEHNPYPNSLDNQEYLNNTFDGATSLTVILEYQTESTFYDWIYLYDKDNKQYGKYGGTTRKTETITIPGDTLRITFKTDGSGNNYYGFKATITPNY